MYGGTGKCRRAALEGGTCRAKAPRYDELPRGGAYIAVYVCVQPSIAISRAQRSQQQPTHRRPVGFSIPTAPVPTLLDRGMAHQVGHMLPQCTFRQAADFGKLRVAAIPSHQQGTSYRRCPAMFCVWSKCLSNSCLFKIRPYATNMLTFLLNAHLMIS